MTVGEPGVELGSVLVVVLGISCQVPAVGELSEESGSKRSAGRVP